jgi:hypothetical protein
MTTLLETLMFIRNLCPGLRAEINFLLVNIFPLSQILRFNYFRDSEKRTGTVFNHCEEESRPFLSDKFISDPVPVFASCSPFEATGKERTVGITKDDDILMPRRYFPDH